MLDLSSPSGKLLVSLVLGTAVGLERELSDKPAGLKTNVLICLGSTLFTILSLEFTEPGQDPSRVAAQIVSGIGFLGAGAIMREGDQVTGLTTAAMIWLVAAIGMAVGMGFHTWAAMGTLAALSVQVGMSRLDYLVDAMRQRLIYRIMTEPDDHAVDTIARILKVHHIRVLRRKVMKRGGLYYSEWSTLGPPERQAEAARQLLKAEKVIEVQF